MSEFPKKLRGNLAERVERHSMRDLPTSPLTNRVDFSSNDYLGFAHNGTIFKEALEVLQARGLLQNGATGSRLLTGNHTLYAALEDQVAAFHKARSALVFNSGYDANLGFFGCVPQRGDIVLYDELIHASIRDGIRLGKAMGYRFRHNDIGHLKTTLERWRNKIGKDAHIYVVTESVFSMDGDSPDLTAMVGVCQDHGGYLIVDEAHAVGIFGEGRGLVTERNLEGDVFARLVTFGKALGGHGAAILGTPALREYLINFARSLIFTTALAPHTIAIALTAYKHLGDDTMERRRLMQNIYFFKMRLEDHRLKDHFIPSDSAIQSCLIRGNQQVREVADQIREAGFEVSPIRAPTVAVNEERLRFCLHSFNSTDQITGVLERLETILRKYD